MSHFLDPIRHQRFQTYLLNVQNVLRIGDIARASAHAASALREGFEHPLFLHLAAVWAMQEGRPLDALPLLEHALLATPRDVHILNTLGLCHIALGDFPKAILTFDFAVATNPDMPVLFYNRGVAREGAGILAKARADYERAVALQPAYPEALARLANDAASRGDSAAARDYGARALKLNSGETLAEIAIATADLAEGKFEEARNRLTAHLQDTGPAEMNRAIAIGLIGDALDGAGKPGEAFAAYTQSNQILETLAGPAIAAAGGEPPLACTERLARYFKPAPPLLMDMDTTAGEGHVFLVGFPRSGTTLLEQALAGHPNITTSEEKFLLGDAVATFIVPPDGLDRLAQAPAAERARLRMAYWSRAGEAGLHPQGKMFIDKLPLNSVLLPLVAVLFPHAKIIFALRDPRDVVFSCFRRRFAVTAMTFPFLRLEDAARYYDGVMRLSEIYRAKLALAWHDVRHEDLVADFERKAQEVCEFLEIGWDGATQDFAARAKARAVDTPSTAQLARGLNRDGVGAWRRYRNELESVMPLLAPWVQRFGYSVCED